MPRSDCSLNAHPDLTVLIKACPEQTAPLSAEPDQTSDCSHSTPPDQAALIILTQIRLLLKYTARSNRYQCAHPDQTAAIVHIQIRLHP